MRLAVAVVSNRDHPPDFTRCLCGLIARLCTEPIAEALELKISKNCSLLPLARQNMLDECVREGFTHILMLDDDMVYPSDLAHRMAAHGKRAVGVNSLRKNPDELHYTARDLEGNWIASKGKNWVEQVATVGMAMFLLDLDVLKNVPKPYFEIRWNKATENFTGEDNYFCRKLAAAKEPIFIDHALANECGHVGSLVYTFDFYDRFRK